VFVRAERFARDSVLWRGRKNEPGRFYETHLRGRGFHAAKVIAADLTDTSGVRHNSAITGRGRLQLAGTVPRGGLPLIGLKRNGRRRSRLAR
jgi:hypothetical protein